jgi:hypothetical protein
MAVLWVVWWADLRADLLEQSMAGYLVAQTAVRTADLMVVLKADL